MNGGLSHLVLAFLSGFLSCVLLLGTIVAAEPGRQERPSLPRWRDNSDMVFVRGGEFVREGGHKARVRSFYIDQYEVTNEQLCEFPNDGHAQHFADKQAIEKQRDRFVPKCCKGRWPVYAVSWDDAVAYARWAGKRLPIEAEWQWAAAGKEGNYMIPKGAPAVEVPLIETVVAGFASEVHGMGGLTVRPHVLVKNLSDEDVNRFDAVAIPACVGAGRGQHTWAGQAALKSDRAVAIVRRVHQSGGIISTMCAGAMTPRKAKLPLPKREGEAVAYDKNLRTATSLGPGVALEAACLLVRELVSPAEYRSFRQYNPWLFGDRDQFPPRVEGLR